MNTNKRFISVGINGHSKWAVLFGREEVLALLDLDAEITVPLKVPSVPVRIGLDGNFVTIDISGLYFRVDAYTASVRDDVLEIVREQLRLGNGHAEVAS